MLLSPPGELEHTLTQYTMHIISLNNDSMILASTQQSTAALQMHTITLKNDGLILHSISKFNNCAANLPSPFPTCGFISTLD